MEGTAIGCKQGLNPWGAERLGVRLIYPPPMKKEETRTYKLFRLRKDGTLGPLFIGRRQKIRPGEWLKAEDIPTKGYAHRPGWHSGLTPSAPHLTEKGRVWCECDAKGCYSFARPKHQGGMWIISNWIRVNKILTPDEVKQIRGRLA
jgi:hypothetical protein